MYLEKPAYLPCYLTLSNRSHSSSESMSLFRDHDGVTRKKHEVLVSGRLENVCSIALKSSVQENSHVTKHCDETCVSLAPVVIHLFFLNNLSPIIINIFNNVALIIINSFFK